MNFHEILDANRIIIDNTVGSKKSLFDLASQLIVSDCPNISAKTVFSALIDREKLGSTGIGHGIAIPHARIQNLAAPVGTFIRLENPLDFASEDKQAVDLVFSFIVPECKQKLHLEIISSFARLFEKQKFRDKLRGLHNYRDLCQFLLEPSLHHEFECE